MRLRVTSGCARTVQVARLDVPSGDHSSTAVTTSKALWTTCQWNANGMRATHTACQSSARAQAGERSSRAPTGRTSDAESRHRSGGGVLIAQPGSQPVTSRGIHRPDQLDRRRRRHTQPQTEQAADPMRDQLHARPNQRGGCGPHPRPPARLRPPGMRRVWGCAALGSPVDREGSELVSQAAARRKGSGRWRRPAMRRAFTRRGFRPTCLTTDHRGAVGVSQADAGSGVSPRQAEHRSPRRRGKHAPLAYDPTDRRSGASRPPPDRRQHDDRRAALWCPRVPTPPAEGSVRFQRRRPANLRNSVTTARTARIVNIDESARNGPSPRQDGRGGSSCAPRYPQPVDTVRWAPAPSRRATSARPPSRHHNRATRDAGTAHDWTMISSRHRRSSRSTTTSGTRSV